MFSLYENDSRYGNFLQGYRNVSGHLTENSHLGLQVQGPVGVYLSKTEPKTELKSFQKFFLRVSSFAVSPGYVR
jgi:hypothetical protein